MCIIYIWCVYVYTHAHTHIRIHVHMHMHGCPSEYPNHMIAPFISGWRPSSNQFNSYPRCETAPAAPMTPLKQAFQKGAFNIKGIRWTLNLPSKHQLCSWSVKIHSLRDNTIFKTLVPQVKIKRAGSSEWSSGNSHMVPSCWYFVRTGGGGDDRNQWS